MERILGEWSLDQLKRGYMELENGSLICGVCGKTYEPGEIYPVDGRFFNHIRAMELHVQSHGGMFAQLMQLDKKYTGLTENQSQLIQMMHDGLSDAQIAAKLGVSASTVRHQRFMFREKAKQAKAYLALFELSIPVTTPDRDRTVSIHPTATMVDDRYQITHAEEENVLKAHFSSLTPLKLRSFPSKEKKKIAVLRRLVQLFASGRAYTELEINAILKDVYDDYATLRRYLIEYGFMQRNADGMQYTRCQGGSENHGE